MSASKPRVLFVDDEPKVLHGLRRQLRALKDVWEMVFAESGFQALEILAGQRFDLIVTDMRMPGMTGAELLARVRERYPHMMRVVLTGQTDDAMILGTASLTHQHLSKPCSAETLRSVLAQALILQDLLAVDKIRRLTGQMESLPSLPSLYDRLMAEVQGEEPSVKALQQIISRDVGMAAKVLQLVNSAFFGLPRRITDPALAVSLLGINTVRALVLSLHIFSQFSVPRLGKTSLESFQRHNLAVATLAQSIARLEGAEAAVADSAFTAGLLHDVGKLVLAANLPAEYGRVLAWADEKQVASYAVERQVFGATHAEVGGYLLGLWGLPAPLVEAVAFHHAPARSLGQSFTALTAVHVANVLVYGSQSGIVQADGPLVDEAYLAALGLAGRLAAWQQAWWEQTPAG